MNDIAEIEAPFAPLRSDEIVPMPTSESEGELVLPVPADAPLMPQAHFALGQPTERWFYHDAAGAVLFAILRFDKADGSKEFLPLTIWRTAQCLHWRWKSVPTPRPLYNLHKLAARPDAPVVICEGEKSADAAARIFPKSVATTSPGGANAAEKTDWTALRGRKVLIWPDNDTSGHTYAQKVGATLAALDCDVSMIDATELARTAPNGGPCKTTKDGWDAADAIVEWSDVAALRLAAFKSAKPFNATEAAPAYISHGKFTMNADGLHAEVKRGRGDNSVLETVRVSAPFEILGLGRNPDGKGWGRFLRWRDLDGRPHEKFVADEALQGDASAICAPLAAEGLQIVRGQQRAFANYLSGVQTKARVTVVHRTGWHEIDAKSVFVLPDENIGHKGVGRMLLDSAAHGPYETRGTLAEWREGVATLAADHALLMLSISIAFAGPLLHLGGFEGGGFNLFGQSSRGKTTCLQAAASVWGRGATPGYVRAWRATANGLEGAAAQSSDTVMVLDELGMVDARDAAQAFYGLANGLGKQRASRDGSLREPKAWRVPFLSSGELPVDAKLAETPGRKARAGQLVRVVDVPGERGAGFGVFDSGGPDGDAAALARSIKFAATKAYGTAGPEFVRRLINDGVTGNDLRHLIDQFVAATIPGAADGQVERVAQRFGLVAAAGELAIAFGTVPWRSARPAMRRLGRWNDGLSFAAAQSRPRCGRRLRRFGCLSNNMATRGLRQLTIPMYGRSRTAPDSAKAGAQSANGGFCPRYGKVKSAPVRMPNSLAAPWPKPGCCGRSRKACNAMFALAAQLIGHT